MNYEFFDNDKDAYVNNSFISGNTLDLILSCKLKAGNWKFSKVRHFKTLLLFKKNDNLQYLWKLSFDVFDEKGTQFLGIRNDVLIFAHKWLFKDY